MLEHLLHAGYWILLHAPKSLGGSEKMRFFEEINELVMRRANILMGQIELGAGIAHIKTKNAPRMRGVFEKALAFLFSFEDRHFDVLRHFFVVIEAHRIRGASLGD